MAKRTSISKNAANKKLSVTREFDAPLDQVWKAWTDDKQLDLWWAPKPWKAETKSMDFLQGGRWLYCMVGPDGSKNWCRADFKTIAPQRSFTYSTSFCDENGNKDLSVPTMHWNNQFSQYGDTTTVEVEISFDNEADMHKILEMGLEQGFTSALGNLDELLS